MHNMLNALDNWITSVAEKHGTTLIRVALGIIFLWFGAVKLFPGISPAEELATKTIQILTFHLFSDTGIRIGLAIWETAIGICYFFPRTARFAVYLMLPQMFGTFTPLVFFPAETFAHAPFGLTLEGQYIVKNILLVAAGVSTLRRK